MVALCRICGRPVTEAVCCTEAIPQENHTAQATVRSAFITASTYTGRRKRIREGRRRKREGGREREREEEREGEIEGEREREREGEREREREENSYEPQSILKQVDLSVVCALRPIRYTCVKETCTIGFILVTLLFESNLDQHTHTHMP